MERRHFLKLGLGFAAGAVATVQMFGTVNAAPLPPLTPLDDRKAEDAPKPAVATKEDVDHLQPEQVGWRRRRWRRRRVWGYRRRHWGWRRRYVVRRRYWRRRRYW
ncbi:hypothetical protein RPMA_17395 [Tardiphaga alba]|uniref:Secreted protein n=1 Tax=Tardiphaga alba TaxID=340268 RepID=A0ABX8A9T8_9BRAD|nr:twin-arginine translocation (Tat) [Tardiphaga alba]QUS40408.1 hypothetical protein RPMA_17395 [Tardiphaga alba]